MPAKPDTDDGWFKLAHELDAALAVADFTKGARIVLHVVFAQVLAAKRRTATLSPQGIARRLGLPRSYFGKVIRELVDAGVLEKLDDGDYRFVKDYTKWRRGESPRLSDAELAFVAAAPDRASSYRLGADGIASSAALTNEVTHQPVPSHPVTQPGNQPLPNQVTTVTQPGNQPLPNQVTTPAPPSHSPLLSGGRSEEGKKGEKSAHGPTAAANVSAVDTDAEAEPFHGPTADWEPEITGPGPDTPESKALIEWARKLGGEYAEWAALALVHAPLPWVRSLLNRKVACATRRPAIPVLASILARWRERRQPEWDIESESAGVPGGPVVAVPPAMNAREHRQAEWRRGFQERQRQQQEHAREKAH